MDTLALGPRNAVLDKFSPKDVLSELDSFISYCKDKDISKEFVTLT